MKPKYFILFIIIIFLGYKIWNSESFQKELFPDKYWAEQVKSLEFGIESTQGYIEYTAENLKKAELTREYDIQQNINHAKSMGIDLEKARIDAVNEKEAEMEALKMMLEIFQDLLRKQKTELDQARIELSKSKAVDIN